MTRQRMVIGIVVALFLAQAAVVIGWPYVRKAREARRAAEVKAHRAAQVEPIAAVVLRDWIDHDFARERARGTVFAIWFGHDGPSDGCLRQLAAEGYRVRRGPALDTESAEGASIRLVNFDFSSRDDEEVRVGGTAVYPVPGRRPDSYIMIYRLRLQQGKWKVVGAEEAETSTFVSAYEAAIRYCLDHELRQARDRGETVLLRLEGGEFGDSVGRRLAREGYRVARSTEARPGQRGPVIIVSRLAPEVADRLTPRGGLPDKGKPLEVEARVGAGRPGQPEYAVRVRLRWEGKGWKVEGAERR